MNEDEKQYRTVPTSNLDFNLMLTETLWGSSLVSPELQGILTKEYQVKDEEGNLLYTPEGKPIIKESAYWETLSYYTRDLRLGNITSREVELMHEWLNLAGDFLKEGYYKAFVVALQRAITINEVSQSRGGFLRKMLNTLITKDQHSIIQSEKKRFGKGEEAKY